MIKAHEFYDSLVKYGVNFFAGVPDSLLKDFCSYITLNTPPKNHIITANEGGAIALCAGYQMATGQTPLVYLQNSGIGNAINPLLSLADKEVYSIPLLLLIGWRGEPGQKDEPQHIKQGMITTNLLESITIPYFIIDSECDFDTTIRNALSLAKERSIPVALLVKKDTFEHQASIAENNNQYQISREQALELVVSEIPNNSIIVSTTGMLSRELYEFRERYNQSHDRDFLTVGSMGHTIQIALGIALAKPHVNVVCLDGDGSAIMHLGNYIVTGSLLPNNLKLILFNNGAHDSVGGQPTVGFSFNFSDFSRIAGFKSFGVASNCEQISSLANKTVENDSCSFLEIRIKKGARNDLGRPKSKPIDNKHSLMKYINSL
jgi:phosphonopyruvate decarboxylase